MAYFLELQEVIALTTDNAEKPGCAEEWLMGFVPVEVSKNTILTIKRWAELNIVNNYYLIDKYNSYRSYPKNIRSKKRKKL